jgi:hypothetical protein
MQSFYMVHADKTSLRERFSIPQHLMYQPTTSTFFVVNLSKEEIAALLVFLQCNSRADVHEDIVADGFDLLKKSAVLKEETAPTEKRSVK